MGMHESIFLSNKMRIRLSRSVSFWSMRHKQGDRGASARVSLCCWHRWWCLTGAVMESGVLAGGVRSFGNDTVG